uniref:ATP-binding cassette domain-containing protein n=1 Tax=Thermorudis sp. TaxID=1969470 RepID=A0A7C2WJT3_9BACT
MTVAVEATYGEPAIGTSSGNGVPIIAVRGLIKRFGEVEAVRGIDFEVSAGETFGFLGPNGAGKSTTIKMLCTLITPTAGSATVAGFDVITQRAAVRQNIGLVFQDTTLDDYLTAEENLRFHAELYAVPRAEVPGRLRAMLEMVGLWERRDSLVRTFSGGMKRRLEIARGLLHSPPVLFLDEPTTGLDPESRALLWADLERLRAEGSVTILLTTHYLEEADRLCDRLAIIDHGRVIVEGTPAGLKAELRGDRVTLEVEGDASQAVRALDGLPGVLEAVSNGSEVVARVSEGATAIPLLVTAFERAGAAVSSVTLSRPSLDDVYLHYTGHRYRGEGEPEEASLAAGAARRS